MASASLLRSVELEAIALAGNGQPRSRARFITEVRLRLSAAQARVTEAPCATSARTRSSSSLVHFEDRPNIVNSRNL
jgi:hypothetical protein